MIDYIYLTSFYVFRFFIRIIPKVILDIFLNFISFIIYTIDKKHRNIAKVNLDLAYEDRMSDRKKDLIIKKCYKNLLYTLADFVKNQGASKEEILNKVSFINSEILQNALDANKKVIIITGHYGNWELLSLSIAAKLTPISIVGRDLDSKIMNKILTKNREQFDIELLSKTGAMKGMVRALKNNRPIGLLVDQNTSETEGVLIDFFGKKARHTPTASILAKKFNAVIVPAFISTYDNHKSYEVKFYEPIIIDENDENLMSSIEAQANITQKVIENKPEEWFWLHKRWKNQYESLYKNN